MIKKFKILVGDCLELMRTLPDNSVDSVVTDPPYGIRFMGKSWDGKDIEERAAYRASMPSHAAACGENGGHRSIAAEAGKYDLTPAGMRAFQDFSYEWAKEALRVLKPGGHLLSFASARTYHHMAVGIEMAGFEIRDQIMWVFGSGFPKSMNVGKAMDKAAGAEREVLSEGKPVKRMIPGADQNDTGSWIKDNGREYVPTVTSPATAEAAQWDGWGTGLKPAHEPICMARKPLIGTVVDNVLAHGTGAINIDACRIPVADADYARNCSGDRGHDGTRSIEEEGATNLHTGGGTAASGRWPANLIHDGHPEVVALFPAEAGASAPVLGTEPTANGFSGAVAYSGMLGRVAGAFHGDTGSAARFFYCAKTSSKDRHEGLEHPGHQFKQGTTLRKVENTETKGNNHPTVKPTDLMAYLQRLVTPIGGTTLDPFMGSGSSGKAAMREGFEFIGCEIDEQYAAIAKARIEHEFSKPTQLHF
ncbi:DNA methyltransferase [Pseudomonas sp. CF161]|uniref:DNA-methyltransferase n=1 Tax=Pseudomonas sp. CF161 TaxID=911241 RepID=UPI0003551B06|nr:DNA methyltransferase [Pseudomonas sp. CF161]EPL03932.1 putative site-specific DNA methyltransferase [Pseudomonas sp. CF161]